MELEYIYSELLLRIENLTSLYQQMDAHVSETIGWFVEVFLGVLGIIGVALYFLAQSLAKKGIDKAVANTSTKISNLEKQLDDNNFKIKQLESLVDGYRIIDGEKEYMFPPLQLGQPYRTQERFLGGHVVYTVLVDCGGLPIAAKKAVEVRLSGVDVCLRSSIVGGMQNRISSVFAHKSENGIVIEIETNNEKSIIEEFSQCLVQIWYTKR